MKLKGVFISAHLFSSLFVCLFVCFPFFRRATVRWFYAVKENLKYFFLFPLTISVTYSHTHTHTICLSLSLTQTHNLSLYIFCPSPLFHFFLSHSPSPCTSISLSLSPLFPLSPPSQSYSTFLSLSLPFSLPLFRQPQKSFHPNEIACMFYTLYVHIIRLVKFDYLLQS